LNGGKIQERIVLSKRERLSLPLKSKFLPLRERPSRPRLSLLKRKKMLDDPK